MDDYVKMAEDKGRRIIENLIKGRVMNYEFTQEPLNPIDLFVTGYTTTASIEIKDREKYTADFIENLGGHYIKKKKYDNLMKTMESGYTPYFTAIFKDWIYVWDLTKITPEWEHKEMEINNFNNKTKRDYEITYLHTSEAIKRYETHKYKDEQDN